MREDSPLRTHSNADHSVKHSAAGIHTVVYHSGNPGHKWERVRAVESSFYKSQISNNLYESCKEHTRFFFF